MMTLAEKKRKTSHSLGDSLYLVSESAVKKILIPELLRVILVSFQPPKPQGIQ